MKQRIGFWVAVLSFALALTAPAMIIPQQVSAYFSGARSDAMGGTSLPGNVLGGANPADLTPGFQIGAMIDSQDDSFSTAGGPSWDSTSSRGMFMLGVARDFGRTVIGFNLGGGLLSDVRFTSPDGDSEFGSEISLSEVSLTAAYPLTDSLVIALSATPVWADLSIDASGPDVSPQSFVTDTAERDIRGSIGARYTAGNMSFGVGYHSATDFQFEDFLDGTIIEMSLPSETNLNLSYRLNDLTLAGGYTLLGSTENRESSSRIHLGAEYGLGPLALRAGLTTSGQAVSDEDYDPASPDSGAVTYTGGFGLERGKFTLDAALALTSGDRTIGTTDYSHEEVAATVLIGYKR